MSLIVGTVVYTAPLASLPFAAFPTPLDTKIAYDATAALLRFTGAMTDADKVQLRDWRERRRPRWSRSPAGIKSLKSFCPGSESALGPSLCCPAIWSTKS
jgi:hypothetical protein